jgi:hypothetical protein
MFFTNKHVVIAMLVSPVLAILAWFAVGHYAGEKPSAAAVGESYPLVAKSNCRYDSGRCELENADFKLAVELKGMELVVQSAHSLKGLMVAVGESGRELAPTPMARSDSEGMSWRHQLKAVPTSEERIYLVASTAENTYFGDAATAFIKRK